MKRYKILVVDDDISFRLLIGKQLKKYYLDISYSENGKNALEILQKEPFDLVISDQMMPEMDGIELLKEAKKICPDTPFIILTAFGDIKNAVTAIKLGAYDYLEKPYRVEDLVATISRAIEHKQLTMENKNLKAQLQNIYNFQNFVTKSPAMIKILRLAEKVAKNPETTILILGESGTGKEMLARAIHYAGDGMANNFVAVNCAAIPPALLESELFGHVKGAFTGAYKDREGKIALAKGGTLLLDEIGDMPLETQAKLLRVLQEKVYEKLGSDKQMGTDCRIIASTHRDLAKLVEKGLFRDDLYHRLNVFPLHILPLRERKEDIPVLTNHFLEQLRIALGKQHIEISKEAMDMLLSYDWPGNVRELRNCLERAIIVADNGLINEDNIILAQKDNSRKVSSDTFNLPLDLSSPDFSLQHVIDEVFSLILQKCGGNKTLASKLLKIDRKAFYRRKK
ncbi:MAG: sigma-54 dependent transcriptional regulator [Proteobacteria bacterium]|nr:sigma-54 dependent transcriptional regulator [Pseudomonadota bacterium]